MFHNFYINLEQDPDLRLEPTPSRALAWLRNIDTVDKHYKHGTSQKITLSPGYHLNTPEKQC